MKLVHVIHCCSAGGAEILAKSIIENVKRISDDYEIQLWVIYKAAVLYNKSKKEEDFEQDYIDELCKSNIKVRIINKMPGILGRINMVRNIRKFYSEFKPDIIHCHLETVTFHIALSLLFKRVKIIETIHNIKINHIKIHKLFLNKRLCKYIAISEKIKEIIKDQLKVPEDKIVTIYNGIDISVFKNDIKFNDSVNSIVSIGRLTGQKDHITLLKAFKILKEKCIENNLDIPHLNIVGDGELKNNLENFVHENNIDEVRFCGVCSNIPEILKSNDIYVMSSIYEGVSLSLMEAAASGISIICTDVGCNSEIITRDGGWLIEKENPEEMAETIYEAMNDVEKRKKFYLYNRKIYEKFDIKECAAKHISVYDDIAKKTILYVGSISKKYNRLDGVTVKSRILEEYLKKQQELKVNTVDVDSWQKRFPVIIGQLLRYYNNADKIVICSSSRGAYILLSFLYYIRSKKDIFYFIAGGELGYVLREKISRIKKYKKVKKMYCESKDMVEIMKCLGLNNIEKKNNFREVMKRPEMKCAGDNIKFVFFSRVVKEKGIESLINSFLLLQKKYSSITLDIYGQVKKEYLAYLKKRFTPQINYRGTIEPDGTREYDILSQYDVFVLPTYHSGEGLPGALIDAYISGLAVLVSNWKYAHEFVDDKKVGLIHEYKSNEDLYKKMEWIINNKNYINIFKENSYKKAEEFFTDNILCSVKYELRK